MMQAIAGGLVQKGTPLVNISVVEPNLDTQMRIRQMGFSVLNDGNDVLTNLAHINIVVLAVKPQIMYEALLPLSGKLTHQLVLSIAAGIRIQAICQWLNHPRVVRAMPNTPGLIQAGISGIFAPASITVSERATVETLLASIGKTCWVKEESLLDAITAVSGSGPAYVFYVIEALEMAAQKLGFDAATASLLALETFRGASLLAAGSTEPASQLRANVTSKRGTTEAAIKVFDDENLQSRFIAGVMAAAARASALGDEFATIANVAVDTKVTKHGH